MLIQKSNKIYAYSKKLQNVALFKIVTEYMPIWRSYKMYAYLKKWQNVCLFNFMID